MLGRVKDAVADAAETLRRAFAGPPVHAALPGRFQVQDSGPADLLAAEPRFGLDPPLAEPRDMPLLGEAAEGRALEPFGAVLQREAGWASWGAEARVARMVPLESGRAARMTVPPLPARPAVAVGVSAPARPAARRAIEPMPRPVSRRLDAVLASPPGREGLALMLARPVPIQGQDPQRLPKGLWMRYSLQLVRGTGENVRNLEVLGVFRIPRKGVLDLRHDARQGRILLGLAPEAVAAPRAPFILARRKDDGALVSCFVEDK